MMILAEDVNMIVMMMLTFTIDFGNDFDDEDGNAITMILVMMTTVFSGPRIHMLCNNCMIFIYI